MKYKDKTILTVMMQWGYCKPELGISGDKVWFFDNLKKLVGRVEPFWFDEYLENKEQLQIDLLNNARQIRPDLIFFMTYTDQFTFETLDILRKDYTTFAWFGDDQWRFDSYSSKYAPHFTRVSTTDPWSVYRYKHIGVEPILTQWAAQPFTEHIGLLASNEKYEYDVTFVGGYNEFRRWFIKWLKKQGIRVECFGTGWPNGMVTFEQMEQIFLKSRINLNLSNSLSYDIRFVLDSPMNIARFFRWQKRVEQIKARNFEIPLAGGFQLSNYVPGLEQYLDIGNEIAVYITPEECSRQIYYYLENEEKRKEIILRSYKRVKNEHTYLHRLESILREIWH